MGKPRQARTGTAEQARVGKLFESAVVFLRQGDGARAEQLCNDVIASSPRHANAWYLRGVIALQRGADQLAVQLLERAAELDPKNAVSRCDLGAAYNRLGRNHDAARSLQEAIALNPELAEPYFNLGIVLRELGRPAEAAQAFQYGTNAKPGSPNLLAAWIRTLTDAGYAEDAIVYYQRCAGGAAKTAELHHALGAAYVAAFRFDEAVARLQRAIELAPSRAAAHCTLAMALANRGEVDAAVETYRRTIALDPSERSYHSNLIFTLAYDARASSADILAEGRAFCARHLAHVQPISVHPNRPDPERRLRIGYLSADFRRHVLSLSMLPLFKHHDRQQVEIFGYSLVHNPDEQTAQYRQLCDGWCGIVSMSDEQVAQRIQADQIDVLVDLTMHSAGNRIQLFARKPAPLQVCWAAYPGTTGLSAIDYRITDPYLDPQGHDDALYGERSYRLPDSFWCYEPDSALPEVTELPAARAGHINFGCFNAFRKVNRSTLTLWAYALRAVPESRLVLLAPEGEARRRTLAALAEEGIGGSRLELVPRMGRAEYLALYQRVDLCLDTVPYNGHTTSLDAFWMGVPVLTLLGTTVAGRAGASLANNLALPELVARTETEFGELAAKLCANRQGLADLRRSLRQRMQESPLMDAARYARNMEGAYRTMWRRWCQERASDLSGARLA